VAIVQRGRLLYLHRRRSPDPQLIREDAERGNEDAGAEVRAPREERGRGGELFYHKDTENTEFRRG
jgi:hypothetical protein